MSDLVEFEVKGETLNEVFWFIVENIGKEKCYLRVGHLIKFLHLIAINEENLDE